MDQAGETIDEGRRPMKADNDNQFVICDLPKNAKYIILPAIL